MNDIVPAPERGATTHPPLLIALSILLFLEALLVAGLAAWLLIDLLTVRPESYPGAIAIVVLVGVAAVWVTATAIAAVRARGWSRASAVTIQILQIAIAVGSFQGFYARTDLGWALLVPAVIGVVLALTPQVTRATTQAPTQGE
jgi:hypothetical protein